MMEYADKVLVFAIKNWNKKWHGEAWWWLIAFWIFAVPRGNNGMASWRLGLEGVEWRRDMEPIFPIQSYTVVVCERWRVYWILYTYNLTADSIARDAEEWGPHLVTHIYCTKFLFLQDLKDIRIDSLTPHFLKRLIFGLELTINLFCGKHLS